MNNNTKPGAPSGNKNAQRDPGGARVSLHIRLPHDLINCLKSNGSLTVTAQIEQAIRDYLKTI